MRTRAISFFGQAFFSKLLSPSSFSQFPASSLLADCVRDKNRSSCILSEVERGKRGRRGGRRRGKRMKPPTLFFGASARSDSKKKQGLRQRVSSLSSLPSLRSTLLLLSLPARPSPRPPRPTSAPPTPPSRARRRRWPRSRTTNAASCSARSSRRRRLLAGACCRRRSPWGGAGRQRRNAREERMEASLLIRGWNEESLPRCFFLFEMCASRKFNPEKKKKKKERRKNPPYRITPLPSCRSGTQSSRASAPGSAPSRNR